MVKTAAQVKQQKPIPFKAPSTRRTAEYYKPWGGSKIKRDRMVARKRRQSNAPRDPLKPKSLLETLNQIADAEMLIPKVIRDLHGLTELIIGEN